MDLQQNLNLITRILRKTVGLQYVCKDDFILTMKGKIHIYFSDFLEIWQYCAEPALCMILCMFE